LDAIELLNELTDEDVAAEEDPDVIRVLYDALVCHNFIHVLEYFLNSNKIEQQILELLMQNITRFNEENSEEKTGVFNILSIHTLHKL
jgi:hypothetical protein